MAGLVPAIHVFLAQQSKDVDARHKAGHDEGGADAPMAQDLLKLAWGGEVGK
jgi:hypothetical protein